MELKLNCMAEKIQNHKPLVNLGVKTSRHNMANKDVVAGLGEIGGPILQLISKVKPAVGFDINEKLMDERKFEKYEEMHTQFLHICIPFTKNFIPSVISLYRKFRPHGIVIHSTISPGTTTKIQTKLPIPNTSRS